MLLYQILTFATHGKLATQVKQKQYPYDILASVK